MITAVPKSKTYMENVALFAFFVFGDDKIISDAHNSHYDQCQSKGRNKTVICFGYKCSDNHRNPKYDIDNTNI